MSGTTTVPAAVLPPVTRRRLHRPTNIGGWIVWGLVAFFFINLAALISTVVLDSFATTWFGSWIPDGFTTDWYGTAWSDFALTDVLTVTAQVAIAVVIVSVLVGVPAAYALARRNFPGKRAHHRPVPAADPHPADHLRHPPGDGALQGPSCGQPHRRDPRQPGAHGALRSTGHDPVHRADRSEDRGGGADVRGQHAHHLHPGPRAAPGARDPRGGDPGACPDGRHVRVDLPHVRSRQLDAGRGSV